MSQLLPRGFPKLTPLWRRATTCIRVWLLNRQINEAKNRMCHSFAEGDLLMASAFKDRFYRLINERNALEHGK